jgi:hypothetical protein
MNEMNIADIWKAQESKLDRSLQLNLFLVKELQQSKAKSKLDRLANFKVFAVVLGILWSAFLGLLTVGGFFSGNPFFYVSTGIIFLFNVAALVVYIREIVILRSIDYAAPVIKTQGTLARLKLSNFNIVRILLLQIPFYSTFFWTTDLVLHDTTFQLVALPVTFALALFSLWLYLNIRPGNMHKKWLKAFMNAGPEHRSLVEAGDFLTELETLKKEV